MRRKPRYPKCTDGVFAAVIRDYMRESPKWTQPPPVGYSEATKTAWRRELELAARPEILGSIPVDEIRPSLCQGFLDALAHLPGKQANAYTALKQLEKWAIVRDRLPGPIMLGCEVPGVEGGHVPWSEEQVAFAEANVREDLARVITIAAKTGQRESDLVKMRWTDIETLSGRPGMNVIQRKTKKQLWIPLTKPLVEALDRWERRPGFILLNKFGEQWTANALSSAWKYQRDTVEALAPLKEAGLVLHGLRATACVRLHHAGASALQISDMVGMSLRTVEHYLRFSIQKQNAMAAVIHLDALGTGAKILKLKGS